MCHKRFVLEEQAGLPRAPTPVAGAGRPGKLGPPFLPSLPWGPVCHPFPFSLPAPPLSCSILLDQRGRLEVKSGLGPGTRPSALASGSLGKPELRRLQAFSEMLCLGCTAFSVFTGTVGSRRRGGAGSFVLRESKAPRSSGRSGVFVVGEPTGRSQPLPTL